MESTSGCSCRINAVGGAVWARFPAAPHFPVLVGCAGGIAAGPGNSSTADGLLKFDYRIHPGKLTRGNALKIIRLVGLLPE